MACIAQYTSKALLLGHEKSLLLSRTLLLARLGCACVTASTLPDFRLQVLRGDVNLIILCQTTDYEECSSASAFAMEHLPDVPLLIMFSRHLRCEPQQPYVLLEAVAGPEAFLQTTGRMLAQASLRAAGAA